MYVGTWASATPGKIAAINGTTGDSLSYAQLNARSIQVARRLRARGLRAGDRFAIFMENRLEYLVVAWAALRSGMCAVPVSRYASADDLAYIVGDCGAKALFSSSALSGVVDTLPAVAPDCRLLVMVGGAAAGWEAFDEVIRTESDALLADETMGSIMSYTSGTTGRPKGVVRPVEAMAASAQWPGWRETGGLFGFDAETVYLSPAPLYHAAPMRFIRAVHIAGGTVVMMEKFDAEPALRLIERYRVTHSQWVPTMFVRMLKLPAETRLGPDLSSHQVAVHAAAPCPLDIKRRMIAWWGPIVHEYYGSTDGAGMTSITCEEWLAHPGSVGRADPDLVKVCREDGTLAAAGEAGTIYMVGRGPLPHYLNDPGKTRSARHPQHDDWVTGGDIGHVGADGYLYLTDRKAFTIVSGGVNIYPQAIEDALIEHPLVADAAVFGVPDDDMGEAVKALVELAGGTSPSDELARELIAYCRARLARHMVPRSLEFRDRLPRSPTGKLMKKELRDTYWAGRTLVG